MTPTPGNDLLDSLLDEGAKLVSDGRGPLTGGNDNRQRTSFVVEEFWTRGNRRDAAVGLMFLEALLQSVAVSQRSAS